MPSEPPSLKQFHEGLVPDAVDALGKDHQGAPILHKGGCIVDGLVCLDEVDVLGIATGTGHHQVIKFGTRGAEIVIIALQASLNCP